MRNHVLRDILKIARSTDSHSINLGIRQNITPVRIMRHTSEAGSNPKPAVKIPVRMKMNPSRSKILAATPAVMSQRHCMTHRTMITGSSSAFAVSFRIQYMSFTRNISSPSLSPAGNEPAGYNAIILTLGLLFFLDRSATANIPLKFSERCISADTPVAKSVYSRQDGPFQRLNRGLNVDEQTLAYRS